MLLNILIENSTIIRCILILLGNLWRWIMFTLGVIEESLENNQVLEIIKP